MRPTLVLKKIFGKVSVDSPMRPSQGFWGFREKGYLFSGICGESITFWGFREQGAGG